jgi:hypothetical protein
MTKISQDQIKARLLRRLRDALRNHADENERNGFLTLASTQLDEAIEQRIAEVSQYGQQGLKVRDCVLTWVGRLAAVAPKMSKFVPKSDVLVACVEEIPSGRPSVVRKWASLVGTFVEPSLQNCHEVDCGIPATTLGWFTGGAARETDADGQERARDRVAYGSLFLAPSGGGKTYAMVRTMPQLLIHDKVTPEREKEEPVAVLLTACATLDDLLTRHKKSVEACIVPAGVNLTEADRKTLFEAIIPIIVVQVHACCQEIRAEKDDEASFPFNEKDDEASFPFNASPFYIHVVIDEIGIYPGLFAEPACFRDIAQAIWDGVPRASLEVHDGTRLNVPCRQRSRRTIGWRAALRR